MDFSSIKLVVSDMDGILLNENHEVSSRFLQQFQRLKERNIHFIAASGRQYYSIIEKLDAINNDISVIAENGAMMKFKNEIHVLLKLSPEEVSQCIKLIRKTKGCYIVLCARKTAYIESNDSKFYNTLKQYYTKVKQVEDLTQVSDDDFLKIAIYHFESTEDFVYPHVKHLEDDFQITVSGQNWLDISHKDANKAFALDLIQKNFSIDKSETLVFGDYNNDLGMLELADFSYAMENAHPNVKKQARFQTKSNSEEGVEEILDELLLSNS